MYSMTMAYLMNSAMRTSTLFGFHNYKNEKKKQKIPTSISSDRQN